MQNKKTPLNKRNLTGQDKFVIRENSFLFVLLCVFVLLILGFGESVRAATVTVCESGCDYSSLSNTYNNVSCGDIIQIQDNGIYDGPFIFNKICTNGNELTITSMTGNFPTITETTNEPCITISGNYHILNKLTVDGDPNDEGIKITGDYNTIQNCTVDNIGTDCWVDGQCGDGILIDGGEYNIVQSNIVDDCGHSAIAIYSILGTTQYNQILNNTITNNQGHGISLVMDNVIYNLVDGNTITGAGENSVSTSKSGIQISGGQHNSIRRNILYDLPNRAFEISAYSSVTSPTSDNWIYNNTIYNTPTRMDATEENCAVYIKTGGIGTWALSDNKFYNNIFDKVGKNIISGLHSSFYGIWILGYFNETDAGDNETALINNDWNGIFLINNCIRPYHSGAYQLTYDHAIYYQWCCYGHLNYSVTGVNDKGSMMNNITTSPSFQSTDTSHANWWYLSSGSGLINHGAIVTDPNATIGGWSQLSYSGVAPDIGAYEYSSEDLTPPSRSNPQPTGTLTSGTTSTTISLDTDETAECKYDTTSGVTFDQQQFTFDTTGGTSHSTIISDLSDGNSYAYYVRCEDTATPPNQNTDDFEISFSIATHTTYSLSNFINLVTDWLKSESGLESDVNGDGVVNTRDLGIMMSNWSE